MGYNRFPDEKGTESTSSTPALTAPLEVTTVTPMKRGLKVQARNRLRPHLDQLQPLPR